MKVVADLLTAFELQRLQLVLGAKDAQALSQMELESPLGKQCHQLVELVTAIKELGVEQEMQTLLNEVVFNSLITWYFG